MRAGLVFAVVLALAGCGGERVAVVDSQTNVNLSGNWNDADSHAVAAELIPRCLRAPWLDDFARAQNRTPVVRVAHVRTRLQDIDDEIDPEIVTDDLQRALIASGKARAVASRAEASLDQGARDTRREMAANAAQAPRDRQELAPDFILTGSIVTQDDEVLDRGVVSGTFKRVKFYKATFSLTDATTNEVVWTDSVARKKLIEQSTVGW